LRMTLLSQCSKLLSRTGSSTGSRPFTKRFGAVGLLGAVVFTAGASLADGQVSADEMELHAGHYHWPHKGLVTTYDHAALRRGFQVYREVCQACHVLEYTRWRMHVDVCNTKEEIKTMAAEYQYPVEDKDGVCLTEDGEPGLRPGIPNDYMPKPYDNEIKARLANNGALPPPMTLIAMAREHEVDYIFSLLTGYEEPPAGQAGPGEGQAYNPYFLGCMIGMTQQLYNESVDYEDGTIPYQSQLCKDVCEYLAWTANMWMDETQLYGIKAVASMGVLAVVAYYMMRARRAHLPIRQIFYTGPKEHNTMISANGVVNLKSNWGKIPEMVGRVVPEAPPAAAYQLPKTPAPATPKLPETPGK